MLVCTSLENIISERGQTQKATYCMISSVQQLSRVRLFATPWIAARQASLSVTNSWSLLKFMSIESVMPASISSSVVPFSSLSTGKSTDAEKRWTVDQTSQS